MKLALLLTLLPLALAQDYSEPPGGCRAPVDEPAPARPAKSEEPRPAQPAKSAAQPAKSAAVKVTAEDAAAEQEQRAYEQELAEHARGDGDWVRAHGRDRWRTPSKHPLIGRSDKRGRFSLLPSPESHHPLQEAIEREHLRDEFWRSALRNAAAAATMAFVLWLLWSRVQQLRGQPAAKATPRAGYRAPDKAELATAADTAASAAASDATGVADNLASPGKPTGAHRIRTCTHVHIVLGFVVPWPIYRVHPDMSLTLNQLCICAYVYR